MPDRPAPRRRPGDRPSTSSPSGSQRARDHGVEAIDLDEHDDLAAVVRELTGGRGPDSVIDAVGMEAHGAPVGKVAQRLAGFLPDDSRRRRSRLPASTGWARCTRAIELVRRGGTDVPVGRLRRRR